MDALRRFFGQDIDFSKAATMWSIHHLIYSIFALLAIIVALRFSYKVKQSGNEDKIKKIVIIWLIFLEVTYHLHNFSGGIFSIPLHICSFAVLMNITLLLTDKKEVFNYAFFFGVLGGIIALTIPNTVGYTYYNFRYYHFILIHISIIMVPIYYYKEYGYRVNYKTTLHVFRNILIMGIVVFILNGLLDTNYWFIRYIPENVSGFFLDWNVYILTFALAVFISMNLLYFISNIKFKRAK